MSRPTLAELRADVLRVLDDDWQTPTDVVDALGYGHNVQWIKVALVLERLAHQGVVELRNPHSRGKRYFRRRVRS